MLDELEAVVAVRFVEQVADLALACVGFLKKTQGPRLLPQTGQEQSAGLKEVVELAEDLELAEVSEMELLIGQRGFVTVVKANRHEVANDAPGTFREGVQVIPALLN